MSYKQEILFGLSKNNDTVISLLENFIQTKIIDNLALFTLYDLFTKQEFIVKYTSHIIYNDLQTYIVNIIKQNAIHANPTKYKTPDNIVEQICFTLLPIISFQVEKYIDELRQIKLRTHPLERVL